MAIKKSTRGRFFWEGGVEGRDLPILRGETHPPVHPISYASHWKAVVWNQYFIHNSNEKKN